MRRHTHVHFFRRALGALFGLIVLLPVAITAAPSDADAQSRDDAKDDSAIDDSAIDDSAIDDASNVGERLLVIHDSVILGARDEIEANFPDTKVDYIGFGGLRVGPAADILAGRPDLLTDKVVVEIGTNYLGDRNLFRTELDRLMGLMVGVEHVVWLTNGRYSTRMDAVNEEIRAAARRYPNLQIAEWGPLSDINGEYTWGDGIHLQPGGAVAIAELIREHLEGEVPWNRLPVGRIGSVRDGRKAVTVKGWASNPDLGRPTMVRLVVDGELVAKNRTDRTRSALANQINSDVTELGFQFKVALPDGRHDVCIEANNFDGYPPVVLHCRTVEIHHSPVGTIERVVARDTAQVVRGWATDPDSKKMIVVQARRDDESGDVIAKTRANRTTADGTPHRFALKVPTSAGGYCIVARNLLAGDDTVLGCFEPG